MNLAFYGTLRDPDVLASVLGFPLTVQKASEHTLQGFHCERIDGEAYPLLRTDPHRSTVFDLYHDVSEDIWRKLVEYESEDYSYVTLDICNKSYRVFIAKDYIQSTGETWTLEDFQNRYKTSFLKELQ